MLGPSFAARHLVPERMDDPGLEPGLHEEALAGLSRIHRASASAAVLWAPLAALLRREGRRTCSLLDVAGGGGSLPLALQRRARQAGAALELTVLDKSPRALEHARRAAHAEGGSLRALALDVLAGPLPGPFDVVTCSLFLHHLAEPAAEALLARMAAAAGRLLLVLDLSRSAAGWLLAWTGTRLLSRSPVVAADGPLSVRAAFTPSEARALAARAGLTPVRVLSRWPCRWLLQWEPP